MQIGRRIYYDKATGYVLQDTGERSGNVVETTVERDFTGYVALADRVPETVGVLQLQYGEHADHFARYPYRVNPVTQEIIWDADGMVSSHDQLIEARPGIIATSATEPSSIRRLLARSVDFVLNWRTRKI